MPEPLADQIIRKLGEVGELYHRLVILAAPSGSGKTVALQEVASRTGYARVNLNLELSRRLLDLTVRQRTPQIPGLLAEIIASMPEGPILLDNIEMLFEVSLKQDPLRCLQTLSRNRTLVVAWNGTVGGDSPQQMVLTYAAPDHPEYRRYRASDLVIVAAPPSEGV